MTHTDIDAILCVFWTLAYSLALIGTEKYKYPIFPPSAQLMIAPLEFSVLLQLITIDMLGTNHVFISYAFWTILEIAIIISHIRQGFIRRHHVAPYLIILTAVTLIMSYLVVCRGYQLFFALFNTLAGEIIWLFHVRKKDYPIRPMVFVMFLAKFVADVMSVPVYFGRGSWLESLMGVLIPTVDFLFIHIYFSKLDNAEKTTEKNTMKESDNLQRGLVKNEYQKHK